MGPTALPPDSTDPPGAPDWPPPAHSEGYDAEPVVRAYYQVREETAQTARGEHTEAKLEALGAQGLGIPRGFKFASSAPSESARPGSST